MMRRFVKRAGIVTLLCVLCASASLCTVTILERRAMGEPLRPADAMIVLGARVLPDGQPGLMLHQRIERAAVLYHEGYAPMIVVCGGQGEDEPRAEADVMADLLIERGVPEEAILREPYSRDTRQNLANAAELLRRRGISEALIVTSDFHLPRALYSARRADLTPWGAGVRTPSAGYLWLMRAREVLGWGKTLLLTPDPRPILPE